MTTSAFRRSVVIVSGGGAISPFTTPDLGCAEGLSAGSTDTGLREALLQRGVPVFTSPAFVTDRPAASDRGANGFSAPPDILPVSMTVNSLGPIAEAGRRLAAFIGHLAAMYGVEEVDLVCHSMGGIFARAALMAGVGRPGGPDVAVRSLVALGTPWQGSAIAEVATGRAPAELLAGDPVSLMIADEYRGWLTTAPADGAAVEGSITGMMGPDGVNARARGALGDVPLTLVAGGGLRHPAGDPLAFPHDGLVTCRSALGLDLGPEVLDPVRRETVVDDVHSIYYCDALGLPWERALTWDPAVVDVVFEALTAVS